MLHSLPLACASRLQRPPRTAIRLSAVLLCFLRSLYVFNALDIACQPVPGRYRPGGAALSMAMRGRTRQSSARQNRGGGVAAAADAFHFFSDGAPGRKLVGQRSDGVCSSATLVLGEQKYACVPYKAVDGQGRTGKALDRSACHGGN